MRGTAGVPPRRTPPRSGRGGTAPPRSRWRASGAAPAAALYLRAADLAFAGGDPGLGALALANAARAQWADPDKALATVGRAEEALAQVPDSHARATLLLNLGLGVDDAAAKFSTEEKFVEFLKETGVNTIRWGFGGCKSVSNFYADCASGKTILQLDRSGDGGRGR